MPPVKREKTAEAERFRVLRKKLDLTQVELGEIMGRHQSMIAGYESGKYPVHPADVKILNKKFGISYEWFYNGIGKMFVGAQDAKNTLIKDVATLNNSNEELSVRLSKMESLVNKLVRDFYAMKNGVAS